MLIVPKSQWGRRHALFATGRQVHVEPWNNELASWPEYPRTKAPAKMANHTRRVSTLPPAGRAVVDADRFPKVAGRCQAGEEYPTGRLYVETGILLQPMADVALRSPGNRSKPRYPPAIHLQWSEIVAAIAVGDLGTDPAAFLIPQSPERLFQPSAPAGRSGDACRDDWLTNRTRCCSPGLQGRSGQRSREQDQ